MNSELFKKFFSDVSCGIVGGVAKTGFLTATRHIYNRDILLEHTLRRSKGKGLITVCNHVSTIDDPGIFGILLDMKHLFNSEKIRWSLGAKEIMFTNAFYRWFFGDCGKVIPIERGAGLNQYGVHLSIEKLNQGDWVHLFPEGKIITGGKLQKLRWGIGKLIESSNPTPYVIPIYHLGLDKVMPGNILPRPIGKDVSVLIGEPLYFDQILKKHREQNSPVTQIHIDITLQVEQELRKLEEKIYSFQKFHN